MGRLGKGRSASTFFLFHKGLDPRDTRRFRAATHHGIISRPLAFAKQGGFDLCVLKKSVPKMPKFGR